METEYKALNRASVSQGQWKHLEEKGCINVELDNCRMAYVRSGYIAHHSLKSISNRLKRYKNFKP